ncbi:hypothetical protein PAPYR_7553 [Paratrimastix pyriformis]|uniref:DNA-directed DNA polymerase n=1 Tax=Paratrimastix pyriformis TaxID=342808 RepID=A0ABQ8UCM8_9EUKA|nr:hypothetical protein PAPYR_7553 [Paratrimastix pyriformis]
MEFSQRFDDAVSKFAPEFCAESFVFFGKRPCTVNDLKARIAAMTEEKEYKELINNIEARHANWCLEHGKIPNALALVPYCEPAPAQVDTTEEAMGCVIEDVETSQRQIRNEVVKLATVQTSDVLGFEHEYRNALVFCNNFYFVRRDGTIELRNKIRFQPELQRDDCFCAVKPRHVLEKAINEFNLHFNAGDIAMIGYDIETYSPNVGQPKHEDPQAHIGMICAVYRLGTESEKHAFIWDDRPIDKTKIPACVTVHRDVCEAGMCCSFIDWGFRSTLESTSNFKPLGYDYPWIASRCAAVAREQSAWPFKNCDRATCYSSLFGLHVHMVDMQCWTKSQYRSADAPDNFKLETVLAALKLPRKQRHGMSYAIMGRIQSDPAFTTECADHCFENIIRYCVYDAEAVLNIAATLDYMSKLTCFIEATGITLSAYIMYTQASWGMTKLARAAWDLRDHVTLKWNYGQVGEKNGKYKGAINWSETDYFADSPCVMFDFAGLYPSMMRAYCISPFSVVGSFPSLDQVFTEQRTPANTTYVRNATAAEIEEYNKTIEGQVNPLRLFREDIIDTYTAFAILPNDPFIKTVDYFVNARADHKKQLKAAKTQHEAKYHDTMQWCFKIMVNSLYGMLGSPYACYMFNEVCAAAVTSAARDAIVRASGIISTYGKRLFIDTDSTAVQLSSEHMPPTLTFTTKEDVAAFNAWSSTLQNEINGKLRESYSASRQFPAERLPYISFAFEAALERVLFAKCKNYCEMKIIPAINSVPEFSYRGCQFTVRTAHVRERTLALLQKLIHLPHDQQALCLAKFCDDEMRNVKRAPLMYARKQKLENKDQCVVFLKRNYPDQVRDQEICNIIRLLSTEKKTSAAWAPISDEYTPRNIDYVETLNAAYTSNISRYFPIWLKIVPKSNSIIEKGGELLDRSELMFRVETRDGKQSMRNATVDELNELLLSKRDSRTVHEIIDCNPHKAYFDVERDGVEPLPIESIIRHVEHVLGRGSVTCYSACGPAKQSYHIICNRLVSRNLNKIVARYLKDNCGFDCIDDGVYAQGHTMRCFTQDKLVRTDAGLVMANRVVRLESDPSCESVTLDRILESLITYTAGVPEFETQVLDFSEKLIEVDPIIYQAQATNFPAGLTQYLADKFGDYKLQEANKGRIRIVPSKQYMCELCDRMHAKDGGWISQSSSQFVFHCSRCRDEDRVATFKYNAKVTYHQKLQQLHAACPTFQADHRADEYLNCAITDRLTCIKARMGSGKTQKLARILTVEEPNCTAVMISVRRTLAFDYMKRYRAENSLPFESYMDLTAKQISIHQHPRLVIQVDSLGRLDVTGFGSSVGARTIRYLVLDEVESLLNQVKSTDDTRIVQTLCELMTHADHVVAMDGLLQQSTVRMLEAMMSSYGPRQLIKATRIDFNKDMPAYDVKFVEASFRQSKENRGLTFLTDSILRLLRQDKCVACFISGRNVMESIRQFVQSQLPDIHIVTFSGKDNEMHKKGDEYVSHFAEKREIISNDISKYLVDHNTRLFMYTSTITAGVDINVDHFDTFVHQISSEMSPIETAQAIFRVRKYRMHEGLIVYQHRKCEAKTQSLTQILSLGNVVERAFFDGRCDWTIPQQVLAMLDARSNELMNGSLPFVVQALKQHNYNLNFAELSAPELDPVELWKPDMSNKIICLMGWTQDADGHWTRAPEHWTPTAEEMTQLGVRNNTAYLLTVRDPLFEEKKAWYEMIRDLGMDADSGSNVQPRDVIIYHHRATLSAYHKLIKAQGETHGTANIVRGVALLRNVHDKCTGSETIATLPADVPRPDINAQIKKVSAVITEQGRTEKAVARSAEAVIRILESHKEELKTTHVVSRFDTSKAHEMVYNLMLTAGHQITKWTSVQKRVHGERARVYTLNLDS